MILDFTKLGLRFQSPQPASPPPKVRGVEIGRSPAGEPVVWPTPTRERAASALVLGASGAGKTTLVASALVDEFLLGLQENPNNPPSLTVVDPKGDLSKSVFEILCLRAPATLDRVNVVDPFSNGLVPLNLTKLPHAHVNLEIRAQQIAALAGELVTGAGQLPVGLGHRQAEILTLYVLAALACPSPAASVLWALDALTTSGGDKLLAAQTTNRRARAFLESTGVNDELRYSCATRLRSAFSATDAQERAFAAPTCLDVGALATAPGRITILDLGNPPNGRQALSAFWAQLLLRFIFDHVMSRPTPFSGSGCRIVVDEAQTLCQVLSDDAERILTLGRSRQISLVTMSQGTVLLNRSGTLLEVLLQNCPLKLSGRLAVQDADMLAQQTGPRVGTDESLSAVRGRLVASLTNLPDRTFYSFQPGDHVRFKSRQLDFGALAQARAVHADAVAAAFARYELPAGLPDRLTLAEVARSATPERPVRDVPAPRPKRSPWG